MQPNPNCGSNSSCSTTMTVSSFPLWLPEVSLGKGDLLCPFSCVRCKVSFSLTGYIALVRIGLWIIQILLRLARNLFAQPKLGKWHKGKLLVEKKSNMKYPSMPFRFNAYSFASVVNNQFDFFSHGCSSSYSKMWKKIKQAMAIILLLLYCKLCSPVLYEFLLVLLKSKVILKK